ncbi:hypothetical protein MAIC_51340 [Mycolicibacterium aichiense]|uniref:Uncharacterized protein n=1 Tax=Mycolicibacterium aichiense TaxID=1799 RepID=A0AAD1HSR6_9MYCO|nr:hypothetical protein MAIC_51340 [Mycolicibacterium aichiense]STZ26010.1 membrane protein [Mycolicibacterium aichiense]
MIRCSGFRRLTAIAALTSTVISGCDNTTATPPTKQSERWPAVLSESTFVWSAEPGIDLLAQPIVTLRAYFESLVLGETSGSNDYLYPGFDHAVEREKPAEYSHYSLHLWPELGFPKESPEVGSSRLHVLRVADDGQGVTTVMCTWDWGIATQSAEASYQALGSWRGPQTGVGVQRVRLTTSVGSPPPTTRPQSGPSRYPSLDVFDNWRVVGRLSNSAPSDTVGPGTQWPEYQQDLAACVTLAPEPVERRQFLTTGEHPRSDFPTLPSYPGWPLESQ